MSVLTINDSPEHEPSSSPWSLSIQQFLAKTFSQINVYFPHEQIHTDVLHTLG